MLVEWLEAGRRLDKPKYVALNETCTLLETDDYFKQSRSLDLQLIHRQSCRQRTELQLIIDNGYIVTALWYVYTAIAAL